MVVGPTTGHSGKTLDPINSLGVLKMVVRPLMEVDRARGARAFSVGFSNQYGMGHTSLLKGYLTLHAYA
jgi:hypothetical protein